MNELEKVVQIEYRLKDKDVLFDVGQAVSANRKQVLSKGGTLRTFTATVRSLMTQGIILFALAAFLTVQMFAGGADLFGLILLIISVLFGTIALAVSLMNRKNYRYGLESYQRNNGAGGQLIFDGRGIKEVGSKDGPNVYSWEEYSACVLTEEAVTFLFERPVLLIFSNDAQMEKDLAAALNAFNKGHTMHRCSIKRKRK